MEIPLLVLCNPGFGFWCSAYPSLFMQCQLMMWMSILKPLLMTMSMPASRRPRSSWKSGTTTAWTGWVSAFRLCAVLLLMCWVAAPILLEKLVVEWLAFQYPAFCVFLSVWPHHGSLIFLFLFLFLIFWYWEREIRLDAGKKYLEGAEALAQVT